MIFARGLDIVLPGAPSQVPGEIAGIARTGLLGSDYPDIRPEILVAPGESVARGAPLLRDRHRPGIVLTAPVAGIVEEVALGPRRRLSMLTLRTEGTDALAFPRPAELDQSGSRDLLLRAGLWPAFVTRPFGRIPDPDATPDAIFVAAADTAPGAPDPAAVIGAEPEAFREGIHLLRHVADCPLHVLQPPGDYLVHPGGHVRVERIAGPHPAGLPGTQIDRIRPVRHGGTVWQIGYADVLAIGRLLTTGALDTTRTVALCGPMVRIPRLVRVPDSAALDTLAASEALPGSRRTLSGNALSGRESRFLRRGHVQVTLLPRETPPRHAAWLPAPRRPLRPAAVIPHATIDQALGPSIPTIPLIRALSTGDAAEADRLGVRALLEEDMALLDFATGGIEDFAARLRSVLDRLEATP